MQINLEFNGLVNTINLYHSLGKVSRRQTDDTVDSRYLEFQGTHCNTSRYPYLDISELR